MGLFGRAVLGMWVSVSQLINILEPSTEVVWVCVCIYICIMRLCAGVFVSVQNCVLVG